MHGAERVKEPDMQRMFLMFHAIVCHFIVDDTGGREEEEKITKCDIRVGLKKCNFESDIFYE